MQLSEEQLRAALRDAASLSPQRSAEHFLVAVRETGRPRARLGFGARRLLAGAVGIALSAIGVSAFLVNDLQSQSRKTNVSPASTGETGLGASGGPSDLWGSDYVLLPGDSVIQTVTGTAPATRRVFVPKGATSLWLECAGPGSITVGFATSQGHFIQPKGAAKAVSASNCATLGQYSPTSGLVPLALQTNVPSPAAEIVIESQGAAALSWRVIFYTQGPGNTTCPALHYSGDANSRPAFEGLPERAGIAIYANPDQAFASPPTSVGKVPITSGPAGPQKLRLAHPAAHTYAEAGYTRRKLSHGGDVEFLHRTGTRIDDVIVFTPVSGGWTVTYECAAARSRLGN